MPEYQSNSWDAYRRNPSEENFTPIYEETKGIVFTLCHRILRDDEDAREAFQSAYGRLLSLSREAGPRGEAGDLRKIAGRLAIREANNLRKRRSRRDRRLGVLDPASPPILGKADPAPSPREAAAQRELGARMEAVISELDETYRLPVLLHYFHGMSHQQIAEMLETPVSTISTRIARALRKLEAPMRQAGLGESLAAALAGLGAAELLAPPASLSAAVVFGAAQAMVSAGGAAVAGAAGASLIKSSVGAAILSTKGGIFASGISLGALMFIALAWSQQYIKPVDPPPGRIAVAAASTIEREQASEPNPESAVFERNSQVAAAVGKSETTSTQTGKTATTEDSLAAPPKDSKTPPKIGLFFCASTSETMAPPATMEDVTAFAARDYYMQQFVVPALKGLGFEVYAVVESGTADQGKLAGALEALQLEDRVIDGSDTEALLKLDGIAAAYSPRVEEKTIEAIMKAVEAGVGFLTIGPFGSDKPGNTERLRDFIGMSQSKDSFRVFQQALSLDVVAPEEIRIGLLASRKSFEFSYITGFTGVVQGTPIMAMPEDSDTEFCPMFMRQYGKGHMLVMQTGVTNQMTPELLMIRTLVQYAVNWICKRQMDTNWLAIKAAALRDVASSGDAGAARLNGPPIKAGYIFSHYSDPRPNHPIQPFLMDIEHPYYKMTEMTLVYLEGLSTLPYILIDTGDENNVPMKEIIESLGLAESVLDWKKPDDLKTLDVIVSFYNPYLSGEIVEAVTAAVKGGVGFAAMGEIGVKNADDVPILESLIGITPDPAKLFVQHERTPGHWVENPHFKSSIHPAGSKIQFSGLVAYKGTPEGNPLYALEGENASICPGFTRKLGYGRVLVAPFYFVADGNAGWIDALVPSNMSYWVEGLNWVAGRPMN